MKFVGWLCVFFMAELENKLVSNELGKVRFFPRVREKDGATTDDLPPQEIAAVLALFELLETCEEGKKDSHGNEN
jgi:hypothetical protein